MPLLAKGLLQNYVPFVRNTSARIAIMPICFGHIDQRIEH
jgi:hypothetical protein